MHRSLSYIDPQAKLAKNVVVEPFVTIEKNVEIGSGTWIGSNVTIMEGGRIGKNCEIFPGAVISAIPQDLKFDDEDTTVVIGDNVRLHSRVYIPEFSIVEDSVWIGPGCVLTNAPYPNSPDAKLNLKGVHLLEGAIVGAGAIILPGVRIGRKALIGAGSVVTDDVEDGAVVVGSPARKTKHIAEIQAYSKSK